MKKTIQERFLLFLNEKQLCKKKDTILLAVSGGGDSMVLSDLFLSCGYKIAIAHCNFQLRGKDSDRDEAFVRKYAEKRKLVFYGACFNTNNYAIEKKISIEMAARELRYEWFERIRQQKGYHFIATAHHLNDNAETLLMNLFKGTGIHGLHGIPVKNEKVIRPLLFLTKKEILDYTNLNGIPYVEDTTNTSVKFTRNYIRHEILPAIEDRFPNVIIQLGKNVERFKDAEILYRQAINSHLENLEEKEKAEVYISIIKLKKSRPLKTIAYELFKNYHFSYEQNQQILKILDREPGRIVCSATHQVLRDRNRLIISPLHSDASAYLLIKEDAKEVKRKDIHLSIKHENITDFMMSSDASIAALDADKIRFPLVLRRWKQGDYFYPLGMRKKKKLSRFFIDQKLSLNEKKQVWVLLSGQKIIWIVGMRLDDRFKINENTQRVLKISKH